MAEPSAVNRLIAVRICVPEPNIKGKEMEITSRNTTHGREYIFRYDGQLFVFKSKTDAEIKLTELKNGSLF